jgi:DNA primase
LQRELLAGLLRQAAERGCEIVAATDNDPAGDRYAAELAELAVIVIERVCPYGKDFNEDLCWCVREEGQAWN